MALLLIRLERHVPSEGSRMSSLGQAPGWGGLQPCCSSCASLQPGAALDMQGSLRPWEIFQKGKKTLVKGFDK